MTTSRSRVPVDQSSSRIAVRSAAGLGLFVALAGDGIRHLITFGGYVAVCLAVAAFCLVLLLRARPRIRPSAIPWSIVFYLLLALVSVTWSAYPLGTLVTLFGVLLCTLIGVFVATMLSWDEVIRALSRAIAWVLGLSIVFELFVAVVLRHPVTPVGYVTTTASGKVPLLDYWSRGLLLSGDRIQGFVGNANLLGVIALIGIVVFGIRLASEHSNRVSNGAWLVLACVEFVLTRSSTMIAAAIIVACVLAFAAIVRRAPDHDSRARRTLIGAGIGAAGIGTIVVFWDRVLGMFGKSEDLTGRVEIWRVVIAQAEKHPILGNGFSSPWAPWEHTFHELVVRNGVLQLQAHNAWLDVWMQLGILGLIAFGAIMLGTFWRSWFRAVDRPRFDIRDDRPYSLLSYAPLLIFTILLVQSLTESRILIESGWVLLVMISLKTKLDPVITSEPTPTRAIHTDRR